MMVESNAVHTFVAEHVLGRELRLESEPDTASSVRARFEDLGFANWWITRRLGGRALSFETGAEISRELSYGDAGLATSLYITVLPGMIIELFGTEDQADRVLRPLTRGGGLAIAASEEFGSEVMRGKTTARRSQGGWVLNGTKLYSTNIAFASHYLVLARREDEGDFRFFIVPRTAPGILEPQQWNMSGIRSALTYQVSFHDCSVTDGDVVDADGLRALSAGLNFSRTFIAAMGWGIAVRARDLCMKFAGNKLFRKGLLAESPVFRQQLGEMDLHIMTMETMIRRAAVTLDTLVAAPDRASTALKAGAVAEALAAKVVAGELSWKVVSLASEIAGAYGYTEESLFPKLTRDARVVSFVEGGRNVVLDHFGSHRLKVGS